MSASLEPLAFRPCIVVPVYNHCLAVGRMVERFEPFGLQCFLVDDGSTDGSSDVLKELQSRFSWVTLVTRAKNGGKGMAVSDGIAAALAAGYTHTLQIDADGQHDVASIPEFLRLGAASPEAAILGNPFFDSSAPKIRVWGREISNFLVRLESLRLFSERAPKDVLCGYRLYPAASYGDVIAAVGSRSRGMDFDIDVIVNLCWAGVEVAHVKTFVTYPEDGVSHFRYVKDNAKLVALHLRLLLGALLRLPQLILSSSREVARFSTQLGWSRLPERGNNFWVKFLFWFCKTFGRTVSGLLLRPVILYFILTAGHARRASEKYLRRVMLIPNENKVPFSLVYQHFLNFGFSLIDKVGVWTNRFKFEDCRWHGKAEVREHINRGEGAIMISAHFGSIEIGRAVSRDLPGLKINALMYTEHAARYHEFLRYYNADSHLRIVAMNSASPALIEQLREAVGKGECLGMLGDRVTPGSPEKTVEVPFFGESALFPAGPFILSSFLDAPVFLVFAIRAEDGTYDIYFERFADRITLPRETREESLRQYVNTFAARLEEYCRRAPFQWFNFYDFWAKSK